MRSWWFSGAALLAASPAAAQFAGQTSSNAVNGTAIPNINIYCADASNNAVPCSFGGGGGGGGTVTQGPAGAAAWKMSDVLLDALIAGSGLNVNVLNPTPAHQAMVSPASVAVPANASTLLWTVSTSARTLKIIPPPGGTSCFMNDAGGAASATSIPIPGGYVYNLAEPPPSTNIYGFCTSATLITVSQGN